MEVLIALALMALVVVSAMLVLQWALKGSNQQQQRTQAALEAAYLTEDLWSQTTLAPKAKGESHGFFWWSESVAKDDLAELTVHVGAKPEVELYALKSQRRAVRPRLVYSSQPNSGPAELLTQEAYRRRARPVANSSRAVVKSVDGKNQLLVDGQPIGLNQDCQEPTLSPDETQVAFVSQQDGFSQVFVVQVKSGGLENLSKTSHHDSSPSWSPDGKALVWIRDSSQLILWRGGQQSTLAENQGGWLACPSFGPDGRSLVMMSNESGNPDIFLLDATSKRKTQLTSDAGYDSEPKISPDGSKVVFISNRLGQEAVFTMNLDGSGQRALAGLGSAPDRRNHNAVWR
jgi:Tol biopolymer transport system component